MADDDDLPIPADSSSVAGQLGGIHVTLRFILLEMRQMKQSTSMFEERMKALEKAVGSLSEWRDEIAERAKERRGLRNTLIGIGAAGWLGALVAFGGWLASHLGWHQ